MSTQIELGDVISFGDDPQRWKCVQVEDEFGILAYKIVPIDEDGQQIDLEQLAIEAAWNE